ncbi:MAG: hypothetical protein WDN01_00060 [Rhizomicrobium sp.]
MNGKSISQAALSTAAVLVILGAAGGASQAWAQTTPALAPFHSPFGADKDAASAEAADFNALMKLYDAYKDAKATEIKCIYTYMWDSKAYHDAYTAYDAALQQYLRDYSSVTYPAVGDLSSMRSVNWDYYAKDWKAVTDTLAREDKKSHLAGDCHDKTLPAPEPQSPTPPPEKPAPPPPAEEHWTVPLPPKPDTWENRPEIGMTSPWNGPFGGVQLVGMTSSVATVEYLDATDIRTNGFDDSGSGFGGGVNVGYDWQVGTNIVVGVVLDADIVGGVVNHHFAGGNFIGSDVDFTGSALIRGGLLATPDLLIYGETGVSLADESIKIDFGGPRTDESTITPGFSLGGGAEWMLPNPILPEFGSSSSVFVDYEHTWWSGSRLNTPAASPLFDYTWLPRSNTVTIGLRVQFGATRTFR